MKSTTYCFIILTSTLLLATSCDDNWLNIKRDRALIVPTTLSDMRLLLRNESLLALDFRQLVALSDDDYYVPSALYSSASTIERNAYVWKADIYESQVGIVDWDKSYEQIAVANIILDALPSIEATAANLSEWNDVKGGALHLRARALFNLAQAFCKPYNPISAATDPGVPVRTTSNINIPVSSRSTVKEVYEQITADLEEASELLRETPDFIRDPSGPAGHGWAARCYLSIGNYEKALVHADAYLQKHNQLLDFNTLNTTSNFPIQRYNIEVIQHTEISDPIYSFFSNAYHRVPDSFREMYDDNDLRRLVFFRDRFTGELGTFGFKGQYTGSSAPFSGISTNEVYLIRAECNARLGNIAAAMDDLNTLLETRWLAGTYVKLIASNEKDALQIILRERRKELLFRGLRWTDIRRLNQDPDYATTITRNLDSLTYSLVPNDPKFVLPIPEYVIDLSGIAQNER